MNYLSVCSGIEAATVAWHDLGWKPAGFSEIEKFPSQVLAHHYPDVTNFGDMTKYKEWNINDPIGLLVGGTPCQSFSVAGLRKGLEDPRGNLALTYVGILDKFRPKWCIWENVPGVLSSGGGRDFGSFLGALVELGYGFAYRVLDAQNFGVAQRRRRVFVVGHLGDWKPAAEVLFESESLRGDIKKGRKEGQDAAKCLTTRIRNDYETETFIAFENSRRDGVRLMEDKSNTLQSFMGTGGGNVPCVSYSLQGAGATSQNGNGSCYKKEQSYTLNVTDVHGVDFGWQNSSHQGMSVDTISPTLDKSKTPAVFCDTYNGTIQGNVSATMTADMAGPTHSGPKVMQNMAVRRLTPVECERLQGFPDNYTNIPKAADGNRYKALGNSMAVPVMRWIGQRIDGYEQRGVA